MFFRKKGRGEFFLLLFLRERVGRDGEGIFGGHPFELFKTPRVILTWIVARKVGRCDVGDCFGVDANDLDKRKSDANSPLLFGEGQDNIQTFRRSNS